MIDVFGFSLFCLSCARLIMVRRWENKVRLNGKSLLFKLDRTMVTLLLLGYHRSVDVVPACRQSVPLLLSFLVR